MQLYGSYTSPFVRHCRISLQQSALTYTLIETGFAGSAQGSPSQKIPYLQDGDVLLTDSSTILRTIREKTNSPYLESIHDQDLFCLVSTLLDAAINLFYLEKDGILAEQSAYLLRQQQRIINGLAWLNDNPIEHIDFNNDAHIRLACFLAWGVFRERFSLEGLSVLQEFLQQFQQQPFFIDTTPA